MTFVTTWLAIAGAVAVAVPILIHLLSRQRRKPIEWAAMRFLIEAFRKHRRRLQVEQLLLLAVRCLIVLLLGAALARPLLERAGFFEGGGRIVYFIVDDGLTSGVRDADGRTALNRINEQAQTIMEALDPGDRVGLITASRPAEALLHPPSSDRRSVRRVLDELTPSDAPADLAGAIRRLASILDDRDDQPDHVFAYLLSEFRAGSAALDTPLPAALEALGDRVTLLAAPPAEIPAANVKVTAIEPVRHVVVPGAADGSGQVTVRLARSGAELEREVTRVRLAGDGFDEPEPRLVEWQPGQSEASVDFLLRYVDAGDQEIALTARIDDDALDADNVRYTTVEVRRAVRVVMLDRRTFGPLGAGVGPGIERYTPGRWLRRALEPIEDGPVRVIDVEPAALSPADLRATDVVIAPRPDLITDDGWPMLRDYLVRGGLLFVSPPPDMNVHPWTEQMVRALDLPWRIDLEVTEVEPSSAAALADEQPSTELLRLIAADLNELAQPVMVDRVLTVDREQTRATVLLEMAGGAPFLIAGSPREDAEPAADDDAPAAERDAPGMVVYLAAAPELSWTNLPAKPLMVPLVHEVVRQGVSMIRARQRIEAGEQPALIARGAAEMISPDGWRIMLDQSGRPDQPLRNAGVYQLVDAAGSLLGLMTVNIDPASGRTDPQPVSVVQAWLAESGSWSTFDHDQPALAMRGTDRGAPLAGILLLIVLLLVVLETLLQRWFSHAYRESSLESPGSPGRSRAEPEPAGAAA